jgi:PncC family amidohydrolase
MTTLCCDVLKGLKGKTLVTAESLTGGGIGAALTAISGSSEVYKGGIICYTNWVKENILEIEPQMIKKYGAVSVPVAATMAMNARLMMDADIGLSVTGLAGPGGDEYGNPVGTVCIGYSSHERSITKQFRFSGDREEVRRHAIDAALNIVLEMLSE